MKPLRIEVNPSPRAARSRVVSVRPRRRSEFVRTTSGKPRSRLRPMRTRASLTTPMRRSIRPSGTDCRSPQSLYSGRVDRGRRSSGWGTENRDSSFISFCSPRVSRCWMLASSRTAACWNSTGRRAHEPLASRGAPQERGSAKNKLHRRLGKLPGRKISFTVGSVSFPDAK